MAGLTADHVVRHWETAGYVVMKNPPAVGAGAMLEGVGSGDSVGGW